MRGANIYCAVASFTVLVIFFAISRLADSPVAIALWVLGTWMISVPAAMLVTARGLRVRTRDELAQGYTTLAGEFVNVDLVDATTGVVLRRAGGHAGGAG